MSSWSFLRRSNPMEDRISELPDAILCNILSFLPTKLATSTSILSKRWKSVYLSVSTLDFDDRTFPNFETFRDVVNSIMRSRYRTVRLKSFHLTNLRRTHFSRYDTNQLIIYAVQSGIHDLQLNLSFSIKLPVCVLNCKALTILNLNSLTLKNFCPVIGLPLLKTLSLDFATFRHHIFLINLLSGCPSLEDLHSLGLRVIQYSASLLPLGRFPEGKVQSLPNLIRANVSNFHIPFNFLYKARSLRLVLSDLNISLDFRFDNLTKLELLFASKKSEAHLKWKWLAELFNYCPKLQNFTFYEVFPFERNLSDDWNDPKNVPECLSSHLRTCLFKEYKGTECELQFAKYIIQNSKVLHTMAIQSAYFISLYMKRKMFKELSLCRKGSARCELVFD